MRRRALLAALLAATPIAAAQDRVHRLGVLSPSQSSIDTIRQWTLPELAREGFVEGRNLALEGRSADGRADRLPELARELLATKPDVVIAVSNAAAHALRAVDPGVAIVMGYAGGDPVADGFAASLARPGGRVTGIAMLAAELDLKRIEIAREVLPGVRRIGFLMGSTTTGIRAVDAEATARALGLELVAIRAAGVETYEQAFASFGAAGAEAVVVASFPGFSGNAESLIRLATAARQPLICEWREMAEAGCLIGYGPNNEQLRRRLAFFVARIFRGEPPGNLPIEQPTRFALIVNLRAARALGATVPPAILARADEVIE